ncbi:MAG: glycosyl hydrolase [Pseudomonadota bacterium]
MTDSKRRQSTAVKPQSRRDILKYGGSILALGGLGAASAASAAVPAIPVFRRWRWPKVFLRTPQTWLGHQETLYSGVRWHLEVPASYTEQFNPPSRVVFPGSARVNTSAGSNAAVNLEGFVGAWATDVELATQKAPKMYGFDFSRCTETFVDTSDGNKIKTILEAPMSFRNDTSKFIAGERAIMKDLILSTFYRGGEVSISYHMLNPFFGVQSSVTTPAQLGNLFSFSSADPVLSDPGNFVWQNQVIRDYVGVRYKYFGEMLDEILDHPNMPAGKTIYIRPFHEPNVNFFWWGERSASDNANAQYIWNYHNLFCYAYDKIVEGLSGNVQQKLDRLKFVFSINTESNLQGVLEDYVPSNPASGSLAETFTNGVSVLGLDYYQDGGPGGNSLNAEYTVLKNKANAMGYDHALTEVGLRTAGGAGKLYGDTSPNASPWPANTRTFFKTTIEPVVTSHHPKWVMFWANRLGNSALTAFTPTQSNSSAANFSGLYYGDAAASGGTDCIDVLTLSQAEIYTPLSPPNSFSLTTYAVGASSPSSITIPGGINALQYIPGAVNRQAFNTGALSCTPLMPLSTTGSGNIHNDAIDDFNNMMTTNGGQTFITL